VNAYRPRKIYVDRAVAHCALTREIIARLPDTPVEEVADPDALVAYFQRQPNSHTEGKRYLLLTEKKGPFLKSCPGTKNYRCCNYYNLNISSNCPIECSYCFLQFYLNNPMMVVYANTERIADELEEVLRANDKGFFRVGTGELTDSLVLDDLTRFTQLLVPLFARHKNAILELKTKTVNVDHLLDLAPSGRVMISWSMNARHICETEEHKSATLDERLDAAARCAKHGYRVGFHFDPMIYYKDWETGYRETLDLIFSRIPAKQVCWISLGSLRFPASLKDVIARRFPNSPIIYEELVPTPDGKLHYFQPIREEMYEKMRGWMKEIAPEVVTYLCMESMDVWERLFGEAPETDDELGRRLDAAAARCA